MKLFKKILLQFIITVGMIISVGSHYAIKNGHQIPPILWILGLALIIIGFGLMYKYRKLFQDD